MYILEDRTPSFRTSIAGTSWRTEEILDDLKKCGHGVQIIQHHDFLLDDCLEEYLLLFPKLLKVSKARVKLLIHFELTEILEPDLSGEDPTTKDKSPGQEPLSTLEKVR